MSPNRLLLLLQTFVFFLCLVCYAEEPNRHIFSVTSLLPSTVCTRSTKVSNKASLELVNKHGPCTARNQSNQNTHSLSHIVGRDRARIAYLQSRRSKNLARDGFEQSKAISIPTDAGSVVNGQSDYLIKVGIGSPKQEVYVVMDTGSNIFWTQCKPCTGQCYKQVDPIYDSSQSLKYRAIPCSSSLCDVLSNSGLGQDCEENKCTYRVEYGDETSSSGYLSIERLTIRSASGRSTIAVNDILFGCGQNNSDVLDTESGVMGLDRGPLSFVSQTTRLFQNYFSYCLPTSTSTTGYLTFGKTDGIRNKYIKFTPITTSASTSQFYDIEINGLSVAGQKLNISSTVFTSSGGLGIIDSGTAFTFLPSAAYTALRTAFRRQMTNYKLTRTAELDTCYDFTGVDSVSIPSVSIFFKGGIELPLQPENIMTVVASPSKVCLAFIPTDGFDSGTNFILGNIQQLGMQVVYDVSGGKIGFLPGACN
ncbi:hypothetical protein LWI28_002401 [Acer negundo]|uniref:Peptidase A1 domain-containing protein n=1 Tax=Acer negundo TaxID=4023 RepID=A0AAD5NID2_ACENE|nr:hypothetical protein LWI28_002401 [Acer negundo]